MTTPTRQVHADRLRKELETLGIKSNTLSRADLVNSLEQAGVFEIDTSVDARPPRVDLTDRAANVSNVYIGNGAGLNETKDHKLHIANTSIRSLISGDFKNEVVNVDKVLNIKDSHIDPELIGEEGDIRREGSEYFIYRTTFTKKTQESGWYPIMFGPIKIV